MSSAGAPLVPVTLAGGALALLAVVLSVRHIAHHLRHYSKPQYQLHIVRILAMVPVYSLTSWFALVAQDERRTLVLDLLRDSYEAYVIYNFVVLLINYAGGHLRICRYLEDQPRMPHPWPLHYWLPPLKLGPAFLNSLRASVLQFVFVKPAGAVLNLSVFLHADHVTRTVVVVALAVLNNVSVSCALYGLVLIYHAIHELLLPFRPFEKFLAVKAVVFFSFWQGIALSLAVRLGLLREVAGFTANEQVTGLQDFLICCEMAVAAIAHYYVFSSTEYETDACAAEGAARQSLLHVVDFRDVLSDAKDRFYGGVGFESELREKEPIVPSVDNILGDLSPAPPIYSRGRSTSATSPAGVGAQFTYQL